MSFGFGGSQGTVRYVLMVDDVQATAAINRFKTNVTGLAAPTNSLTQNMGKLNQTFNAGITPLKTQGNALTNLTANLNTTSTTATTLGTKIKDTASKFAGFATGLAVTASGVLQLAAGFRDYNDAQIAVDRVQRKLSLATEAQGKAVDKLNALTGKGVKSGKAYEQAQLDVSQANAAVSIQTDLLGEAQERMFDSQTQFVASVIPTTLGAIGTLGSAFKDLGGDKGIGGLITKFKNLGGSGGIGGLSGKFDSLTSSIGGVGGGMKGLIATTGLLALATAGAVGLYKEINAQMEIQKQVASGAIKPLEGARKELDQMSKLDFTSLEGAIISIAKLMGGSKALADVLKPEVQRLKDVDAELKKVPPSMNAAASSTDAWVNMMIKALQSSDPKKIIEFNKAFKDSGQPVERYTEILNTATAAIENNKKVATTAVKPIQTLAQNWALQSKAFEGSNKSINLTTDAYLNVSNAIVANNPIIQKNIQNNILQKQQADAVAEALKNETAGLSESAKFIQLFGDKNQIAADTVAFLKQKMDEANTGMDSFNKAIQDGADKFTDFISTTELGAVTNKRYTDSLKQWVGSQIKINPVLDLTTSQLEALQTALAQSKVDLAGMSEATKILADAFNAELAPALKTFSSVIGADKFKEFKKSLKDLPGFGDFTSKARSEFSGLLNDMRKVSNAAQEVGTDISSAILGAFEGISGKSLGSVIKELTKDVQGIAKIDIDATKFKPITDFLNNLTSENRASGILKIKDSLALMQDAMSDGVVTAEEAASVTAKFNEEMGKTAAPTSQAGAAVQAFGKSSVAARAEIDQVTGAIDVLKATAESTKPVITIQNAPALKALDVVVKRWSSAVSNIEGNKPKLTIINNTALKALDAVVKRWQSAAKTIEGIKPKLTVNNSAALKGIDQVVSAMSKVKDKSVSINVSASGSGLRFAQKGMHETLAMDTLIQAHKGERVDIGHGGGGETRIGSSSSGGGNGGGGNNYFEVHTHIGDMDIMRKFRAQQGRNRYRFGSA